MSGFLNDELRDWIAVGGIVLALLQTWLSVKAIRVSHPRTGDQDGRTVTNPDAIPTTRAIFAPGSDPQFLREAGSFFFAVALVVALGAVGTAYVLAAGHFSLAPRWILLLSLGSTVVVEIAVVFGGAMLVDWSRIEQRRPVVVASAVYGLWIGITLAAVAAAWWSLDKDQSSPFALAASGFYVPILGGVCCAVLSSIGSMLSSD